MSDIPTNATGVHVVGAHAYLYNRNGTYIADHALASGVVGAFAITPGDDDARVTAIRNGTDDPRALAVEWLDAIGAALAAGCDKSNATAKEYDRLRADVAAVRRVLGVDVADQLVAANAHIAATERAAGAS